MIFKFMKHFTAALMLLCFFACNETELPRKRGYLRIELPQHQYKVFDPQNCPFSFEVSSLATAYADTNALSEPCWWYIKYPSLNGEIYISYKPVKGDFAPYAEDARTLVYKHTQRASAINESMVTNDHHASGIVYEIGGDDEIGGDAASAVQFFMTDSVHHFLRGALYFNNVPNSDSLAPVVKYIRQDIDRMLATLQWK
jgi:gliding motility-associated lipoprotein GldD